MIRSQRVPISFRVLADEFTGHCVSESEIRARRNLFKLNWVVGCMSWSGSANSVALPTAWLCQSELSYSVVYRLKGKLLYFLSLLETNVRTPPRFWKREVSGEFKLALTTVFKEVQQLLTATLYTLIPAEDASYAATATCRCPRPAFSCDLLLLLFRRFLCVLTSMA